MSNSLSSRVPGLLSLAGVMLVVALVSGQPTLAVLAAPFLALLGVGLAGARQPRLTAEIHVDRSRMLEREHAQATITLHNKGGSAVELDMVVARTGHLVLEPAGSLTLRVSAGADVAIPIAVCPERWGAHAIGPLVVRTRDPLGVRAWDYRLCGPVALQVFPREQRLRELVTPSRTQPFLGTHVARVRGEGIEFADIRPFAPGDRVRQVNWRATARRGALYVTERHPEHASDVVLLMDTFAEARDGASGTLDAAVRAAASLARAHLARRDRVALVDFGGVLHWLEPAFGATQLYRIIDALISSEIAFSYAWRAVESIPRRVLPPGALILVVSPLLDERSIRLITDLRTRGADLTLIEVSPLTHTFPGASAAEVLAFRLWRLQRDALRSRLQALGIGVALWQDDDGLGPALEGVNSFRRSVRQLASS